MSPSHLHNWVALRQFCRGDGGSGSPNLKEGQSHALLILLGAISFMTLVIVVFLRHTIALGDTYESYFTVDVVLDSDKYLSPENALESATAFPMITDPIEIELMPHKTVHEELVLPPAKFILYRAIGNDLPPRHETGQCYRVCIETNIGKKIYVRFVVCVSQDAFVSFSVSYFTEWRQQLKYITKSIEYQVYTRE